jgi:hypothetical protein
MIKRFKNKSAFKNVINNNYSYYVNYLYDSYSKNTIVFCNKVYIFQYLISD